MTLTKNDYLEYLFRIYALKQGTITKSWSRPSIVDAYDKKKEPVSWPYYLDFSKDIKDTLLRDSKGVPMIDYANLGIHYNPWFIGHIALGYHTLWSKSHTVKDKQNFKKLADWFVTNAKPTENGVAWFYQFDYFGGQEKPWKSGLSQAHAISTLLRAATLFNKYQYSEIARLAVDEMITDLKENGSTYYHADNSLTFEEYLCEEPYSVLNGHLFSTFACWEASVFFKDKMLQEKTEMAFNFVINNIERYDLGFWSTYSLKNIGSLKDIASHHYHDVHIAQLEAAYHITGLKKFKRYSDKFRNYQKSFFKRYIALAYKSFVKILS